MIAVAQKTYSLNYRGRQRQVSAQALAKLNDSIAVRYKTADVETRKHLLTTFLELNAKYIELPPFSFSDPMDREDWLSVFKSMIPRAFEVYNPSLGHVHSYLIGWKHASFNAWLRDNGAIRLPENQRLRYNQISRKMRRGQEICEADQRFYENASFKMVSINTKITAEGDELQDVLTGEDPRETAGSSTDKGLWAKVEELLKPDDLQLFKWKFHPDYMLTSEEIGERMGYTHQRASQRIKEIREKLRIRLSAYLKRMEREF